MKYLITERDEDIVSNFIEKTSYIHLRYNRSDDDVKEDIRIGKLGEIAYKNYAGDNINDIYWSGLVQFDGLDFKSKDGNGIQVKTMHHDSKWVSFKDWKWDILAVLRNVGPYIYLIGEFEKDYIKSVAKKSNWKGWYFNPDNC